MYKGLAQLVGMDDRRPSPNARRADDAARSRTGRKYDFFFIHFKYTDSTGEDGNFDAKVKRIEEFDAAVPRITALKPDVLHRHRRPQHAQHAQEPQLAPRAHLLVGQILPHRRSKNSANATCLHGGLGQFEAKYLMTLALANAGRLGKYGT